MKNLSRTARIILLILMTIVMTAAQLLYCLHGTLMSSAHLSRLLEDEQKLTEVTAVLYSSLDMSKRTDIETKSPKKYIARILGSTEEAWVKSQVYILSKALHQYIFEASDTLPTIDITPLKKSIRTVVLSDIMQSDDAKQKTAKVKAILTVLNNKYFAKLIDLGLNSQLISMLLELSPVKATGFDSAAVQEIVRIYLSLSNKDISLDQASYSITEQLTADMLKLNQIKDYFDFNLFMDKAFGDHNPLKNVRVYITSLDKTISRAVKVLFCCLLLLLCVLRSFRAVKLVKDTVLCLLASGILSLLAAALMLNFQVLEKLIFNTISSGGALSYAIIKYTGLLIKDSGLYLALQSALTVFFCAAVLLIVSRFKEKERARRSIKGFPIMRITLIIFTFTIIFSIWSSISVINHYHIFKDELAKLSAPELSKSITQGLAEAGGMEFLNLLESK